MSGPAELAEAVDKLSEVLHRPVPAPAFAHVQAMDVNLATREVFVGGEIGENFGDWFTCALRFLEAASRDPVVVWLNTPGGDFCSMFVFHDLVRQSPCDVVTVGVGEVCSAGVLMLACGHRRLVSESCVLMSHRDEGDVSGNLEELEAQLKVVRWQEEHWARLMDRYTPAEVEGKARDERYWFQLGQKASQWWIMGGEAIVGEGIADAVLRHELLPETARRR